MEIRMANDAELYPYLNAKRPIGKIVFIVLGFVLSLSIMGPTYGQDSAVSKTKVSAPGSWSFKAEPYLMLPAMNGKIGVGNLPEADVDASVSDIFSKLAFGAMLNVEAENAKWTIGADFLYMDLEQDLKSSAIINSGQVNARQMGLEVYGMRKVKPWLELGVGALWNSMSVDMELAQNQVGGGTVSRSGGQTKNWVDPMIIARMRTKGADMPKKIYGVLKGEVGGFGVGSDFAWQLQMLGGYRFSRLFDVSVGYRFIGLDYKDGNDSNAFAYDVVTSGLMIKFGFHF